MSEENEIDPSIGLCSVCLHTQRIVSGRGSIFYLCRKATTDERFRRYPSLPVVQCVGFEGAPA